MKTSPSLRPSILRASRCLLAAALLPLAATALPGADATENWAKQCASCHGKDGKGETKAGKKAGVKDQTDPGYHAKLTDDQMFKSIKEGLKEGEKERMKPFAEKLTDDEIKALVAHVRSFKK
ncbi:MAG TPA: cytochrome C [Verrucomicrobiales bacterium]|nr:cytochrome C [Verrucomicrobiales bacterium]